MIRSLRARLFLGICAVSVLVLGILSFTLVQAADRLLEEEFDSVLLEKARTLASLVEQSGPSTHFDYQPEEFPEFQGGARAAYFEIYLDGKSYQRSASLGEGHLPEKMDRHAHRAESFALPDGRHGRLLVMPFEPLIETDDPAAGAPPKPLPRGIVVVAQDSSSLQRTLERLRLLLLGLGAGATLLAGTLLVWVAGRAIRPVQKLSRQIEGMGAHDLSAAISAGGLPSELAPVVDRLNGLLHRLQDAFTRERAFTSDVAHELRTPLAGILATLQVARTRPRDPAAYEASIDKSLAILTQMQSLVENLLLLARADSGQLVLQRQRVSLGDLLLECRTAFEESAARRQLRFETMAEEIPELGGDREILRLVLHNLLDNAVSYAPSGSVIALRLTNSAANAPGDAMAVLEIANSCTSLSPTDLPELFQRFVRKDPSRSATGTHAGLGLSICQRLLALLHGTIDLRLQDGSFIACLSLPATPAPAPSAAAPLPGA